MMTVAAAVSARASRQLSAEELGDLAIEVVDDLSTIEVAWRDLESRAVMTPYGRFDWMAPYARNMAGPVRVALLRDAAERVALILPLAIERRLHFAIGTAAGGKHANVNLPVIAPELASSLTPQGAKELLRGLGRAAGVDLVTLPNVPVNWKGRPNPFAAGGQPSPSDLWRLDLVEDGEGALDRSMSSDARRKLRKKLRAIEKLGPVAVLHARDAGSVDRLLAAFFAQKSARLRELGIADAFADPATCDFVRAAALAGLDAGRPGIEIYGLSVGDRIVAVFGGVATSERFSGMFVSFEAGPFARFSPGELIVTAVVREQARRGLKAIDFGVGEARFKRSVCDVCEPLVEVSVPVTAKGRLVGQTRSGFVAVKRQLKRSPQAMAGIARLRRGLAQLRGR